MKKTFISVCLVILCVLVYVLSACNLIEYVGVSDLTINENGELIVTYTNNTSKNLGKIKGEDGKDGVGIKNITINDDGELVITYTNDQNVNLGKITACGHNNFTQWSTVCEPDCVTHGYQQRQCLECDYVEYRITEPFGHNFDSSYTVFEPTCSKEGLTLFICSVCAATKAEIIEKVDHVFEFGECINCGFEMPGTEELIYEEIKNENGEVIAYAVAGLPRDGDEIDVMVPSFYQGKPVTKINDYAFGGVDVGNRIESRVRNIIIGKNVVEIGEGAFSCCKTLKSVVIGKNVVKIGNQAFYNCPNLETVYWNATACKYAGSIDGKIFEEAEYVKNIYIGDDVTRIPDFGFTNCPRVECLNIPSSVKYIGAYAFVNMLSLKNINFDGTIDEWEAIVKGNYWTVYVTDCTVHCTDGDIPLPITSFN
ncbi:MAG: leucine-rich repeat domain-containing protein [Clostridia bacterium]|nr:leucine-rich repeat domain-containing protein [Clostridia bacterium]